MTRNSGGNAGAPAFEAVSPKVVAIGQSLPGGLKLTGANFQEGAEVRCSAPGKDYLVLPSTRVSDGELNVLSGVTIGEQVPAGDYTLRVAQGGQTSAGVTVTVRAAPSGTGSCAMGTDGGMFVRGSGSCVDLPLVEPIVGPHPWPERSRLSGRRTAPTVQLGAIVDLSTFGTESSGADYAGALVNMTTEASVRVRFCGAAGRRFRRGRGSDATAATRPCQAGRRAGPGAPASRDPRECQTS